MEIRLRKFGHSLIDIAIELCSIFAQKKKTHNYNCISNLNASFQFSTKINSKCIVNIEIVVVFIHFICLFSVVYCIFSSVKSAIISNSTKFIRSLASVKQNPTIHEPFIYSY